MVAALTQADLIFPTQTISISSTLHELKRSALSIHNRLRSITSDAEFVTSISAAYGLPLVANERCGSWYIPTEKKVESVYFKSTDGHTNEWSFSLRRLNLQLIDVIGKFGGCVIVDSTRRGKSMPDALSKTIPIWCCVINRALFTDPSTHTFHTSPRAVSPSEHAQIESRINIFVREFLDTCQPEIGRLRSTLQKPLRPIWVTQKSTLPENVPDFPCFHPIVLSTASRRVHGAEGSEAGYIQGAADDHEAWAGGLTPPVFWKHKEQLLKTNEVDLPSLIANLVVEEPSADAVPILIRPTSSLYVSSTHQLDPSPFDIVISCTSNPLPPRDGTARKTRYLHLKSQTGKLGSRDLRFQLPLLPDFFSSLTSPPAKILICDPTGKDLAVGVALVILCLYADLSGAINPHATRPRIDKKLIKQRLAWCTTTHPTLNPPRGTLQSVNAFLMPDPSARVPLRACPSIPPPPSQSLASTAAPSVLPTRAAALFAALAAPGSSWRFSRMLTSALPTHPSGSVRGTATFARLSPSASTASASGAPPALLYVEEGVFTTTTQHVFTARQKYVYQLGSPVASTEEDETACLSVHFYEEGKGIGGLFVEMGELEEEGEKGFWKATNREQHLCAADLYTASWRVGRGMLGKGNSEGGAEEDQWWEVRYDVKGPKKDYVSETRYTRG